MRQQLVLSVLSLICLLLSIFWIRYPFGWIVLHEIGERSIEAIGSAIVAYAIAIGITLKVFRPNTILLTWNYTRQALAILLFIAMTFAFLALVLVPILMEVLH